MYGVSLNAIVVLLFTQLKQSIISYRQISLTLPVELTWQSQVKDKQTEWSLSVERLASYLDKLVYPVYSLSTRRRTWPCNVLFIYNDWQVLYGFRGRLFDLLGSLVYFWKKSPGFGYARNKIINWLKVGFKNITLPKKLIIKKKKKKKNIWLCPKLL